MSARARWECILFVLLSALKILLCLCPTQKIVQNGSGSKDFVLSADNQTKKKQIIQEFKTSWCTKNLFARWGSDHPHGTSRALATGFLSSTSLKLVNSVGYTNCDSDINYNL